MLKVQGDPGCVYLFACQYNRQHADAVLDRLMAGATELATHPRVGISQQRYEPREVRKVFFGDYEVHYEIRDNAIYIVDLWHTKEDR